VDVSQHNYLDALQILISALFLTYQDAAFVIPVNQSGVTAILSQPNHKLQAAVMIPSEDAIIGLSRLICYR
jgi:hypothetical protein